MKIQVRSALTVAKVLSGKRVFVDVPEPLTLGDLLDELTRIYGQAFRDAVCDENGYTANKAALLVNGVSAAAKDGLETRLKEGDDVLILPVISGG